YDLLTRYEFSDLLRAAVKVFVVKLELGTEFVGATFNFFRPPPSNVVDRVKDFFWRLVYCKRNSVILSFHEALPFCPDVRNINIGRAPPTLEAQHRKPQFTAACPKSKEHPDRRRDF